MPIFTHKRTDTFKFGYQLQDDFDVPIDQVAEGITLKSQIRRVIDDSLVAELTIGAWDADLMERLITYPDSSAWPVEQVIWDVQHIKDGEVFSTETIDLKITKGATRNAG